MSNAESWPLARCCASAWAAGSAHRNRIDELGRVPERGQRAGLTSASSTRELTSRRSTREQKSRSERELAAALARVDDRLDRALADVLHGQEPEADRRPLDREVQAAAVDVRRPDLDPEPTALGDRRRDLLGVVAERGQHAEHMYSTV